ncbi:hypothetical protein R1sor_011854 [Riccia sorocarpa]|uniref:HMA domain-containing protein n=1 Tax=Riccia sorocarpa TaxID=122646 RepID=A0ABD3I2G9_9MARC
MSISQDEKVTCDCLQLFYRGHNPSSWYSGANESWIMKAIAAANAEKDAEKKKGKKQQHVQSVESKKQEAEKKKNPSNEEGKKAENAKNGVIELRMALCCEGCIEKVHRKLKAMDGVSSVVCDQERQKVIVKGDAKPEYVLKKARKIHKRADFFNSKERR